MNASMESNSHSDEDARLLSISIAFPLRPLPNLDPTRLSAVPPEFAPEPLDSCSSARDHFTSSMTGYQPIQVPHLSTDSSRDRKGLRIEQIIVNRWLVELSACAGSLLTLFAILIFLYFYDGRAQPDWPYHVTINSVISWFTTLMKALMLVSVTACLSQANWIHFRTKPQAFRDFLIYDSASRGPRGSLQLLWDFQGRYIASIGAVITILAIAIDPTVQQMVTIRSDQRNSTASASLGRAQTFLQYVHPGDPLGPISLPTIDMIGAIYSGIFFHIQDLKAAGGSLNMDPSCPTGNCTFPLSQSLAICSSCEDVSQALTHTCPNKMTYCEFSLPNGLRMNKTTEDDLSGPFATSGYLNQLQNGTQYGNTFLTFSRIKGLYSQGAASLARDVNATQCLLYWCVNTYASQVANGQFSEEVKASWYSNETEREWWHEGKGNMNAMRVDLMPPGLANDTIQKTNPNFTVSCLAELGILQFLAPKLTLSNSIAIDAAVDGLSWGPDETSNSSSYTNSVDFVRVFRDSDMNNLFTNLANSMTRNIRDVPAANQTDSGDRYLGPLSGVGPANGTASYEYIYVSVQWPWLAYSATLVFLTIIFLLLTIIYTARHDVGVWKSSPMPLLFSGLSADETERLRAAKGIVEMESLANGIEVALKDDSNIGSGVRLAT